MEYEIKVLVNNGNTIYTQDGEYIASISMTKRAKSLLDKEDWEKQNESWLEYYERTEQDRKDEELKRFAFVQDLVTAYNTMFVR